jgi:hypothetical protein
MQPTDFTSPPAQRPAMPALPSATPGEPCAQPGGALARTIDVLSTALTPSSDPGAIEYASWIRLLHARSA